MTTKLSSWLDIRSHGYLRVAAVSPTVHLANPELNANEHIKLFNLVYLQGAQVAIATECGISGYTVWDLIDHQALNETILQAINKILQQTKPLNMIIVFGSYLNIGSSRYNVAIIALKGRILAIIPKSYLASSGEFRDERWIRPGVDIKNQYINLLGQKDIPFGSDILIQSESMKNLVLHVQVCQDLWVPVPPSSIASVNGATVCATINASPEIIGKEEYQIQMNKFLSASNFSAMVYSSTGVGESSTDLVFAGRMIIAQQNNILTKSDRFDDKYDQTAIADIDLSALVHDRRNDPSFQSASAQHLQEYRRISFSGELGVTQVKVYESLVNHKLDKLPFVPSEEALKIHNCTRIWDIQVAAVVRRLEALPIDSRRLIVAISGGSDSALALMVAARAMDKMKLSRKNIIGITMPGLGTTATTYNLAVNLIKQTGATFKEIKIGEIAKSTMKAIGHDTTTPDLTFENSQVWARKYIEWMLASFVDPKNKNSTKGVVLGTGDLSELILGWCTYAGDQMSHYNPNANIPKTLIWFMLEILSEIYKDENPKLAKTLLKIRNLQPTPELLVPSKIGGFSQISEDKNGKYIFQDFNIYHLMRWGDSPSRIARKMYEAYDHKLEISEIKRWLEILMQKFLPNQFKRSTLPDGVLVGTVGVSPRDKFKIPSDADKSIWLGNLQNIPTF